MKTLLTDSFEQHENWTHNVHIFPTTGAAYLAARDNIFVPGGWTFWFRHGKPVKHDPDNADGWAQPEGHHIHLSQHPERIRSGNVAWMYFGFYRAMDAGLYRRVKVTPGTLLRLRAWGHAWSNWQAGPHPNDPRWSDGDDPLWGQVGYNAFSAPEGQVTDSTAKNFTFWAGIDPTGGVDPYAPTVKWGQGAHIYNAYAPFEVDVRALDNYAEGEEYVTLFLRTKVLWRFLHNDAYLDDVVLYDLEAAEDQPAPGRGAPRIQYERTYILMPPNATKEWAIAAVEATWDSDKATVGGSADDAAIGDLDYRQIVAVNPQSWQDSLADFYHRYYDDELLYHAIEATTPEELKTKLRAFFGSSHPFELSLAYPTTHLPPVITSPFNELRTRPDGSTYYHKGLDLRSSWYTWGDEIQCALAGEVINVGTDASEPWFGYQVRTRTGTPDGREILVRYAHLVANSTPLRVGQTVAVQDFIGLPDNTGESLGDHLHIDAKVEGEYVDPAPLIQWPSGEVPLPDTNLPHIYGVHEDTNGEAARIMQAQGITGNILWTEGIGADPSAVAGRDYRPLCAAYGHTAIVRLNYGYHDQGTIPTPDKYDTFAQTCAEFVRKSQGCNIWIIGNEMNNPREYPGNTEGIGGTPITPEQYIQCYSKVYAAIKGVRPTAVVMPGAVDGYNGVQMDSRGYIRAIFQGIVPNADAVCMHAYTHGPDKELVKADVEFGNEPLLGLNYNFKNFEDLWAELPAWARWRPIYITETNHLWLQNHPAPDNPTFGWLDERTGWIQEAHSFVNGWNLAHAGLTQVRCLLLYRYPHIDPWVIQGKGNVIADWKEALDKKYRPYRQG